MLTERHLEFRRILDEESGRYKVYASDGHHIAWVWSSFSKPPYYYRDKVIPRKGILGWLGFQKVITYREPNWQAVEEEALNCWKKDCARLLDIFRRDVG